MRTLLWLWLCFLPVSVSAQSKRKTETERKVILKTEDFMNTRIALVDEFVKRFNYMISPDGKSFDSLSRVSYNRELTMITLFNEWDEHPKNQKSNFQIAKKAFIENIITDSIFLKKADLLPYAELETFVVFEGKEKPLKLYLKKFNEKGVYDWKIIGAVARFLKPVVDTVYLSKVRKDTSNYAISPHAQETDFLSLRAYLRQEIPLLKMVANPQQTDGVLIALSKAIQEKKIIFEEFDTNVYLNTHRGWIMQLKYYPRETNNSGWLINELYGGISIARLTDVIQHYINNYDKNLLP